mgnify:FL=1|jgi:hypothetical protein
MENLIKIWKSRNQIAEGVKNNIFKTKHVEDIAFFRNEICRVCEFIDTTGAKCAVPGTQPCCGECGCSLKLKTRSLSSDCPRGFWKAELTEQEEAIVNQQLNIK